MMRNMHITQKWRKLLRPVKNSAGMTMVEVLIAFAVLMLVLALANTAVQTSLNLSNMAEDVRQKTESVLSGYYNADRAASETSCSFGEFSLKTYPGVYNDETTGYSIYWFHDGQDHTPHVLPGVVYPEWLPNADWAISHFTKWDSWHDWWNHVHAEEPRCEQQWITLMHNQTIMPLGQRLHVYGLGSLIWKDGRLCPYLPIMP